MTRWPASRAAVLVLALACTGAPPGRIPPTGVREGPRGAVHLVFHAMDCQLYRRDFERLDSLTSHVAMSLSGTILLGPVHPSELPAVVKDFGLGFPLSGDSTGEQARLVAALGGAGPVVTIWRHRRPVAVLAGPGAISLAELWLQTLGAGA